MLSMVLHFGVPGALYGRKFLGEKLAPVHSFVSSLVTSASKTVCERKINNSSGISGSTVSFSG